jgi:putative flippase GtrA
MDRALRQIATFSLIGAAGFVVDSAVLLAMLHIVGANLYWSRVASFLCAATFTWALNRAYTFPNARASAAARQWARFLTANALGGLVNYGIYAWLVSASPRFAAVPVAAVAVGSLSGLCFNFVASRSLVFHAERP